MEIDYKYLILFPFLVLIFFLFKKAFREYIFYNNKKYFNPSTTILITGGCTGIGKEIIRNFFRISHCKIINLDIRKDLFESLNQEFENEKLINIYCDLSVQQNFDELFKQNSITSVDILINNAGVASNDYLINLADAQVTKTMNVNLISPMLLTKHFITRRAPDRVLHIVTIASVMSHTISQKSSDYVASKWGLYGFHESIRAEFLDTKGIHFSVFCPFCVNTGMFSGFRNPFPFIFSILDVKKVGKDIVKSIIIKDKIVFYPSYAFIFTEASKLVPCFLSDIVQKYFCKYYLFNSV